MSFPLAHFPDAHFPNAHFPHEFVPHGGGGGRKKHKSWDQRERERQEQLRKDEEARRLRAVKDKFGDLPKPLEKVLASPYKRLDPATVRAYERLRAQDDEEAMAIIARLL
jgi:hypothetical protein